MNQPEAPRNRDNTTEQNVHHSNEAVSNKFENTPLKDFEQIQLDNIPESPSTLPENMPPFTTTTEIKETSNSEAPRFSLKAKIAAAIAGLSLAGGAAIGVNAIANNSTDEPPVKNPNENSQTGNETGENPPVTEEQPPVVEEEKTLEQLTDENKIEAGQSPEQFATTFQSRLNKWALAGATEEGLEGWYNAEDKTTYEDELAALQTAQFSNALFAPGYHNEPTLVNSEANFETRNAAWFGSWARSDGTLELDGVIEEARLLSEDPETGVRVLYIAGYDTNNAAEANYASEETRQNALSHNGESWDHTLTLQPIDGFDYVTKWED